MHIAISSQPKTMDLMYEIVIGRWNNSVSVVRGESQGHNLCCALAGSIDPPIKFGVNHYWVSINASSKLVKFGFGWASRGRVFNHLHLQGCIFYE